ncbi:ATP-dependent Clp protease adaptor ClpS [Sulfurimonas aquatica]|uniref:ATP-dependent Clp protease adapter protein ClpS n=1 Tax=Sulfurimonas aquatica TaxID=2672570 RepID=A0A975GDE9_9BACT|nr:ATP-dependent Clp protease adaptor ClpS [Sulfurimonas aquatica]QSZ42517.1 ATP-dependent Clp protease adaptor ClpS [Sulfurimonas aquatica]
MSTSIEFQLKDKTKVGYPKKYKVYLLNDDYTSMDFVVSILTTIFHKSYEDAEKVMLEIHKQDKGLCGVYVHEIAETKVMQVLKRAKEDGFPLRAIMEEE